MADLNEKVIKEIVHLGRQAGEIHTTPNGLPYAVIPVDAQIVDMTKYVHNDYAERPHRKKGTVTALDAASFIAYYQLFADEHSRVFADETRACVLAVLDYHGIGDNAPRWGQHRINLTLRQSEEWKRWYGADGKKLTQVDFAEFIEDNAPDIVTPSAATMLEVARDLTAKTDADFGSAIRLNNGSVQFKYSEQIKASFGGGQLEIPEQFLIAIPVHVGGERVKVTARLRYRLNSGKLTFWYDLLRADVVLREAFLAVQKQIADGLAITIINGSPA